MGIFDRMGKVISSNVNTLLDKTEDQRKLLELNIDEMDDQLKRAQQEVIQAVAAEKQLKKKCDELVVEQGKWDKRAELALKSGDEALAREALKQKKRVTTELDSMEKARVQQRNQALTMKSELERMRDKFTEIKAKRATLAVRATQAQSGGGSESLGSKGGPSAFDNFRRMEEKIEGKEAEVSAMAEVDEALGAGPKNEELEAKFRDLEKSIGGGAGAGDGTPGGGTGSDVDDELAALKKRIRV